MTLSPKSRQALKARAHALKPIILIGNQGLTVAVHQEIDRALTDHSLIKIRIFTQDKDLKRALFQEVCTKHQAELVQTIGHVGVFYRQSDE
jgi:RNA-binding protein